MNSTDRGQRIQPMNQLQPMLQLDSDFRDSPLRVHFVITSLPVGGAEVLLLNLIRQMDKSVFAPEVVCLKEPGALGDEIANEVPLSANLLRSKWDFRVLFRLKKLFRESDAVITIGAGDKMFWGRLAAKLAGVPVICSALHSTGWPDGVGPMNRLLTPITNGFIACARGHAEHLVSHERFPKDKVFMIPNGVNTNRFHPDPAARFRLRAELGVPEDSPLIGIVAALRAEKNHLQFLEAAASTLRRFPTANFVIVGEGPERGAIEGAAASLGVTEKVHLLGNRSDTPDILAGLDVFCLTSRNEANPVSILEALACGIPVVSPDVGSVSETVHHEQTGLLTKPLDANSTSAAIERLLADPTWSRELGVAGRHLVSHHWSLEAMVRGYEELLRKLYNNSARQRKRKPVRETLGCAQPTVATHISETRDIDTLVSLPSDQEPECPNDEATLLNT